MRSDKRQLVAVGIILRHLRASTVYKPASEYPAVRDLVFVSVCICAVTVILSDVFHIEFTSTEAGENVVLVHTAPPGMIVVYHGRGQGL